VNYRLARGMFAAVAAIAMVCAAPAEEKKKDAPKPAVAEAKPADAPAGQKGDAAPMKLETDEDKFSYLIGADIGTNLKQNGIPVVRERFLLGFNDIAQGKQPALTEAEMQAVMQQFQEKKGQPTASPDGTPQPVKPVEGDENFLGQLSYLVGADVGMNLKRSGLVVTEAPFIRAVEDVVNGRQMAMTEDEMKTVFEAYRQKQVEKRKAIADKNLADGKAFLDENAKKPGVKTTASGLQYLVVAEGKGDMPKAADTVKTHYRGTLLDGTEFDSSYARNEPIEFPVNGVIAGWTEALQMMHAGDKWKLFIPSELAYGERGAGGDIGPNSTLVFDIELLEVIKAQEAPAGDGTISLDAVKPAK